VDTATVRDKLWLFGMPIKDPRQRAAWLPPLPPGHQMTTFEAASYLGIHNALFVVQANFPEPPFDSYARTLLPLKRVVWSILGDSTSNRTDLDEVLRLAERFPNITGGIMDDFFRHPKREGPVARYTLEEIEQFRARLHRAARPLELWVVIYAHQLAMPTDEYLERCDAITFWSWWGRELPQLEENFARLEARAPNKPKLLGCYFMDLGGVEDGGDGKLPLDLMKHQCQLGLKWLHEGRLQGIILLGNPVCGLGLETVEWARDWIAEIAEEPL